ncbi:ATP-binding protein [Ramlibacter pallidus]|uniref:histidine kinase n=1 Tax=Ramlibacter pallidus TaxID=2780087 RepID=A0ABR9RYR7_9BURK|nr:ATP-binding protein [Ramlibacter pallidus]MBE7366034.1 sensor histidine kinase N-terminal domain-containing protein [Ramlibacter pallidus]
MSLQRRLMLYLLACAPLVWSVALLFSVDRARYQVNELYDTELIRLARQVLATQRPAASPEAALPQLPPLPAPGAPDSGESDVRDLAVAVWDKDGRLQVADREGGSLPYRRDAVGFVDEAVGGRPWRLYYLQAPSGALVASGQAAYERDELVLSLVGSQVLPWLLVLPVLLFAMAWAVRRALAPIHELTGDLGARDGENLTPVADAQAPAELRPLLAAMNSLFARIESLLARERRFTAEAAHELRTPLAVLRAQWDVVKRSRSNEERARAQQQMDAGLARMDRLVTQMLALSRAESTAPVHAGADVDWPAIVEQVMGDCLELAHRRDIELVCDWPSSGRPALPLVGDGHLLTVLLRNLVDNAARYAPAGSTVALRMGEDGIEVENAGGPLPPEQLAALGQRFHRPPGQVEAGSGLGISIVQRIAALHGLEVVYDAGAGGHAVRAVVRFARPTST